MARLASAGKVTNTTKMQGGAVVEGLTETLRAMNKLDKEAKKAVKDEVQKIANILAKDVTAAGNRRSKRDQWVASSIKGTRERVPTIKIGSAKRMPTSRKGPGPRASDLMFGMEFGSNQSGPSGFRFPPRTPKLGQGNQGYWIYPTIRSQQAKVVDLWAKALEKVAAEWSK